MKKTQLNRAVLERLKNLKWEEKKDISDLLGITTEGFNNALRRESRQLITADWMEIIKSYLGIKKDSDYLEKVLITQPFEIE